MLLRYYNYIRNVGSYHGKVLRCLDYSSRALELWKKTVRGQSGTPSSLSMKLLEIQGSITSQNARMLVVRKMAMK